jgi:hypothetical protein
MASGRLGNYEEKNPYDTQRFWDRRYIPDDPYRADIYEAVLTSLPPIGQFPDMARFARIPPIV